MTSQALMNYPFANFRDDTLVRIRQFLAIYRPSYQDREWAAQKKAEVEAEIRRREQEDKEGLQ